MAPTVSRRGAEVEIVNSPKTAEKSRPGRGTEICLVDHVVKPSGQTAADTKTRVLDAADAVFVRRGIDGARMQDIADQAGVNKALLHYHFRSKADLARAVWLRIASAFVPGIFQMLGSDISLDERIDRFVDAYHTRLAKHPYLLGYVISEAARHPDFVDDFYSAERRKAARQSLERVEQQINERASKRRLCLSRLISSSLPSSAVACTRSWRSR